MKQPDLNLLVALDALLQEHSVSRAAARLELSTPAMSHALGRLREQLGDPLLVRAGQRMVVTPRGADLRDRVHRIAAEALAVLRPAPTGDIGQTPRTFRITATDHVLAVVGVALDRAAHAVPAISLHVIPNERNEVVLLRDGALDLAIGVYDYAPYSELPPDLRIQQLFEERFVCVVRSDHPTVSKSLTLAQYAALEHVQIVPRGQPGGYVDELLAKRGHRRRIARAVPYFLAALALTAESDYVLTVPLRVARRMSARFGLRMVAPPRTLGLEPYHVAQLWHPRNERDAGHRWLRETVMSAAKSATRSRS